MAGKREEERRANFFLRFEADAPSMPFKQFPAQRETRTGSTDAGGAHILGTDTPPKDIVGEFGFYAWNTTNSGSKRAWFLNSPTIS